MVVPDLSRSSVPPPAYDMPTPGVPQDVRQEQYRRFAGEILPRFADAKVAEPPVAAG